MRPHENAGARAVIEHLISRLGVTARDFAQQAGMDEQRLELYLREATELEPAEARSLLSLLSELNVAEQLETNDARMRGLEPKRTIEDALTDVWGNPPGISNSQA